MKLPIQKSSTTAFTLIETLVATSIGVMITTLFLTLFLQAAQEQRRSVRAMTLQFQADLVQEKLTRLFRGGVRSRTAQFLDEDPSQKGFFRKVRFIHRLGKMDLPLELEYRADQFVLVKHSISANGSETENLVQPDLAVVLRDCRFQEIFLANGQSRRSAIQVFLKFDDAAGPSNATPIPVTNTFTRNFSVQFRNP